MEVPFTLPPIVDGPYVDDPSDGFDDSLSTNTPVITTEELRARLEEENRLKQEDARRRADELAALANANGISIAEQNQLDGNSSFYTGSNFPGFSAEETNAAAFDPRGFNPTQSTGGLVTGGGADGKGNLGQVGDFFGGIGDSLGITNFDGKGTGLLSGLNLTGPVTPKSASELQFEADRAPGGIHYEGGGADKRAQAEANANAKLADAAAKQSLIDNNISVVLPAEKTISSSKLKDTLEAGYKPQVIDGKNYLVSGPGGTAIPIDNAAVRRAETKYGLTFAENKTSPTTGFTQAQTDLAQTLFAQGVPAAEVRATVLAQ